MPTYRVSVTCKLNVDYLVNAPDEDTARDADVALGDLVYGTPNGGLEVRNSVTVDVMPDSAEWDKAEAVEVDAIPNDRVRLVVTEEEG